MLTLLSALVALQPTPPAPPPPPVRTVKKRVIETVDSDGNTTTREVDPSEAEQLVTRCTGRKFETEVAATGSDGRRARSHIVLCADGDSDAVYRATLTSARDQIAEDADLEPEIRTALLEHLEAELATLD